MTTAEQLSKAQLTELCGALKLPPPQSFFKLEETRAAIARKAVGCDEYRVAAFLAEQTAASMAFLAARPDLLNAGSIALHVANNVRRRPW